MDETPHLSRSFQTPANLLRKEATVKGVEPLGQITLPCKLCLHSSIPTKYSSSGIEIEKLSPLITGTGNCDEGISQTLEVSACAKLFYDFLVFCGSGFSGIDSLVKASRNFHGIFT